MEIVGKIIQVLEARGGTSARTGNPWKVQSYVLETEEQYPRRMVFEVFGEDQINQMNIQTGQTLRVYFNVDAHEYQGRWFNQIRAWKVESPEVAATPAAQPGVAPVVAAAPAASPFAPVQPEAPVAEPADSTDDLPF